MNEHQMEAVRAGIREALALLQGDQRPIGGLMDKRFKYVPACKTNVAATIARVRAELENGSRKL